METWRPNPLLDPARERPPSRRRLLTRLRRAADPLLDFLLPYPCLACHRCGGPRYLGLCRPCRGTVPRRPTATSGSVAGPALDSLHWGFDYETPVRESLRGLKYRGLEPLGRELATAVLDRIGGRLPRVDMVTSVPLHWTRRWRRGFDQAEAIGRGIATGIGAPWLRMLRRVRWTPPQARRGRARRAANLENAFAPRRTCRSDPSTLSILLVDDVVTTGATLAAAAEAIRRMSPEAVHGCVVARTPDPSDP